MRDFHTLDLWRRAHALILAVYKSSEKLPPSESFGLTILLRRSAAQIATRIADGCGRDSDQDFALELKKARASANELEYLLLLAHDLGYVPSELHGSLSDEVVQVRKMTNGFLRKLTSP